MTTFGALDTKFHGLLQEQIRSEFTAAQQYIAIAVYFDGADLPQLAKHFYGQSVEERNHAMMLVQYLIDRDVGITFRRAMQRLGWWGRAKLGAGLMLSLFGDEEISEEQIEGLKRNAAHYVDNARRYARELAEQHD